MGARRNRRRSQLKGIDEINMTPLIDLTFLLLIVFMITMPMMEYSTDVSVPPLNAESLPDENAKYVNLRPGGTVSIDSIPYTTLEYEQLLKSMYMENPNYIIMVRADGSCSVDELFEAVRMARNAGFASAKVVSKAE